MQYHMHERFLNNQNSNNQNFANQIKELEFSRQNQKSPLNNSINKNIPYQTKSNYSPEKNNQFMQPLSFHPNQEDQKVWQNKYEQSQQNDYHNINNYSHNGYQISKENKIPLQNQQQKTYAQQLLEQREQSKEIVQASNMSQFNPLFDEQNRKIENLQQQNIYLQQQLNKKIQEEYENFNNKDQTSNFLSLKDEELVILKQNNNQLNIDKIQLQKQIQTYKLKLQQIAEENQKSNLLFVQKQQKLEKEQQNISDSITSQLEIKNTIIDKLQDEINNYNQKTIKKDEISDNNNKKDQIIEFQQTQYCDLMIKSMQQEMVIKDLQKKLENSTQIQNQSNNMQQDCNKNIESKIKMIQNLSIQYNELNTQVNQMQEQYKEQKQLLSQMNLISSTLSKKQIIFKKNLESICNKQKKTESVMNRSLQKDVKSISRNKNLILKDLLDKNLILKDLLNSYNFVSNSVCLKDRRSSTLPATSCLSSRKKTRSLSKKKKTVTYESQDKLDNLTLKNLVTIKSRSSRSLSNLKKQNDILQMITTQPFKNKKIKNILNKSYRQDSSQNKSISSKINRTNFRRQ